MAGRRPLGAAAAAQLDQLRDLVADAIATSSDITRIRPAVVVSVTGAGDTTQVLVNYAGADLCAPRLATYAPVVNDVVALALTGGTPLILGRITSTPT